MNLSFENHSSEKTNSEKLTTIKIGLEIHAYINTKSKLFCSCPSEADIEDKSPNSNCCPICLGHPGSKPVLNEKAVELGALIGLALNCSLNKEFFFSRKTYFYPDMASNYQITQYETPIAKKGFVMLGEKKINITRAHIEWDPASLVHPSGMGKSGSVLIDYNRSGMPLVEIVTEPDIESPKQAREFMNALDNIMNYLGALKKGTSMKADCNISINGGNRVEIKNVSGFAAVEKALTYELSRQKQEVKMSREISQHTRAFNAETETTTELRKKETENDYGYIFDPDLVKTTLSEEWIKKIIKEMPELPEAKTKRLVTEFFLSEYDAKVICSNYELSVLFEKLSKLADPKISARILTREILSVLNHDSLELKDVTISVEALAELVGLLKKNSVSDKNAKESIINYISIEGNKEKPLEFLKKNNLLISNEINLGEIIDKIISTNGKAVEDYKSGNEKSINFLAGLVMRETKGAVDPKKAQEEIIKKIKK